MKCREEATNGFGKQLLYERIIGDALVSKVRKEYALKWIMNALDIWKDPRLDSIVRNSINICLDFRIKNTVNDLRNDKFGTVFYILCVLMESINEYSVNILLKCLKAFVWNYYCTLTLFKLVFGKHQKWKIFRRGQQDETEIIRG